VIDREPRGLPQGRNRTLAGSAKDDDRRLSVVREAERQQ